LYAAKLGAKKVIATDIYEKAVVCARMNAQRLGLSGVFEVRLVPDQDISAYSSVKPDDKFDVIISNPPYSINLDVQKNTSIIDNGDLGMSIIKGLEKHLKPKGTAILLYNSYFYHYVMVKFARYAGYSVINYEPKFSTPWEEDALFNSYLKRLLAYNNLPLDAFQFDWRQDNRKRTIPFQLSGDYSGLIIISRPANK
jgi:predicted RNA methylase